MPSNGVAVRLAPEPAPANPSASPGAGGDSPSTSAQDDQIGDVLAQLAVVSVQSFIEVETAGRVAARTKERGGALIADLYQARQMLGATAFDAVAHRQDAKLSTAVVDDLLAIVVRVDATMRAWAN